ncbi:hypothetical protein G6F65_014712 [Rhizopus arrhizus]|nr:hypothetical protein G6F65_014712 [Rhizopus arrhizus]
MPGDGVELLMFRPGNAVAVDNRCAATNAADKACSSSMEGQAMIVALLNQKGGALPPAGRLPAGFIAGLEAAQKRAGLSTAVQRRGPRPRDTASGSARAGAPRRSRHHRRPAAHRRPGALGAAGGRARADSCVPACAARGLRHQPARQHHRDRARSAPGARRPAASCAARGSASAHRVRRQRGRWPPFTRDGAGQRRRPRNHRPSGRIAAVDDMTAKPPPNSKRTAKRVGIGARPPANPHAEAWIRQGDADALGKGDLYTARLTLDITPAMRARIKVSAFTQGVTVADLLRGLLEREFPENRRENTP